MSLIVLAVDDEPPALDELVYLLNADPRVVQVHRAGDATEALRVLHDTEVNAVFLDIRMPGLDGMELARLLRRFARPPAIVFVTAYDDSAVDAFDLGVTDYVRKPVRAERLAESLRRVAALQANPDADPQAVPTGPGAVPGGLGAVPGGPGAVPGGLGAVPAWPPAIPGGPRAVPGGPRAVPAGLRSESDDVPSIPVELAGTTRMVPRSAVRWVEAQGDYARLHTIDGAHLVRVSLTTLAERWADAGFVRIHRSYLVRIRLIAELRLTSSGYLVRVDGVELPVSRRHTRELKDKLIRAAKNDWTR